MADMLTVYNMALFHLGKRAIGSLTSHSEERLVFDALWPKVTGYCLAQGVWAFALRSSGALTQGGGGFGFQHGYQLPGDVIFVAVLSDQASLYPQLDREFTQIPGAVYTDRVALYCTYTSSDPTSGGMLLTKWPIGFETYVAAALARFACLRITGSLELLAALREGEDEAYLSTFAVDSISMWQGLLPFNASARSPRSDENLQLDSSLMPFAAYRSAMARMQLRAAGRQPQVGA